MTQCFLLDLGSPEGIALDHLGRSIFWTDSQQDRIEVAKMDGTQRRVLFDTGLVNPRGIVTDSVRGCVCLHTCVSLFFECLAFLGGLRGGSNASVALLRCFIHAR